MHQYDINKTMMAMMTRGLEITQIVRAYVNAKPERDVVMSHLFNLQMHRETSIYAIAAFTKTFSVPLKSLY